MHVGAYNSISSNGVLTAEPGVVHFGGFELGKVFKQVIRIVNTSPVSRRLHIILPTTPNFKVHHGLRMMSMEGRCVDYEGITIMDGQAWIPMHPTHGFPCKRICTPA